MNSLVSVRWIFVTFQQQKICEHRSEPWCKRFKKKGKLLLSSFPNNPNFAHETNGSRRSSFLRQPTGYGQTCLILIHIHWLCSFTLYFKIIMSLKGQRFSNSNDDKSNFFLKNKLLLIDKDMFDMNTRAVSGIFSCTSLLYVRFQKKCLLPVICPRLFYFILFLKAKSTK